MFTAPAGLMMGGRVGAHFTFHLSEGQPFLPGREDVRSGRSEAEDCFYG